MDIGTNLKQTEKLDEQELFEWVRRKLGYPDVEVEITSDQVKDAVADALAFYSKYKPRRVTEAWVAGMGVTHRQLKTRGARGVYHVEMVGINEGLSSPNIEAQLMSGSYTYYGVAAPKMDLRYYEYLRQWVKVASRELSSEADYHVEEGQGGEEPPTVWIYSPGRDSKVTVELTLDHVDPSTIPSHDQIWIRKYVLAECKIVVGEKRSKFTTILGANKDFSLNGQTLKDEGKTEIEKLEEKIEKARTHLAPSFG